MIWPLSMGLVFLASPLLVNQIKRKYFRKSSIFRGPRSLTVDETGLTFSAPALTVQMKWDSVQSFVEDDTAFVLYQSGLIFHLMPKRQLSQQQISDLREAFTQHITSNLPLRPLR
jgi:hypothetical protein